MMPFSDGEIIEECLEAVAEVAFPDKKIISKIRLSRFTAGRRIELSNDIEKKKSLKMKASNFKVFYSNGQKHQHEQHIAICCFHS
jgi:hypothetical protein